ncbi:MAG TPA: lipopolysaccharide biosynthesis protein [Acidimicrobiales bacterium]|jgi:O-antigen/teichoic acid export membrane protein|nr:lipopolysaccharide biosynthesis protein [Acidimicrobiales bacterium]
MPVSSQAASARDRMRTRGAPEPSAVVPRGVWNTKDVSDEHVADAAPLAQRGTEFRGRRVAMNSMTLLAGQVLFTAIGFVTTPIVLTHIGLVEFGLWGLIMTAVGYITVVDPGFGDLITRYGARAHLEGNRALGARLCSLASLLWLGLGVLGLPLLLWAVPAWIPHLGLHHGLDHVAIEFFEWGYAYTVAGCVTAIMSSRLTAIGDQWLVTVIDGFTRLLYAVVLLSMLLTGSRLSALVVASSVQLLVTFVVTLGFVWRRAGAPYGNPLRLHGAMVREATRFGGWLQLGGVLELLTYETDAFVISTFVSVRRNGTFTIAQKPAGMTTYFSGIAQTSALAALSAAHAAREGLSSMRRMYTRANRLSVLLGCLIGGLFLGTAPVFLAAWLGHYQGGIAVTDGATCLAVAALMLGLPRPAAAAVIMAMGKVGIGVRAQAAAFAINLVLTIVLVAPLGMFGVMLATVVAKGVATGYLLVRFHRLVDGTARELLFGWMGRLVLAVGVGAGVARLALLGMPDAVVHQRGPALVAFLVLGALYTTAFAAVIRATRYFGDDDLRWFEQILPAPLARLAASRVTRRLVGVPA